MIGDKNRMVVIQLNVCRGMSTKKHTHERKEMVNLNQLRFK